MKKILIIDDDIAVLTSLELLLKNNGFFTLGASSPETALKLLRQDKWDIILQDMNFSSKTSGDEGLELLNNIKAIDPSIPVILITAWGSISLAVKGMKLGAADFINKPWQNDHLLQTLETVLSLSHQSAEAATGSRAKLNKLYNFQGIIGESLAFEKVLHTVGKIAHTNASVLITGESGTGKEVIADAIHCNSSRNRNAFVKVNLGGIPSNLFESEMFGHRKGAFTDAKSDRTGRFELAHRGTIFLDEIGDLTIGNQIKLLRVLQERSFEVLGSSKTLSVDFRLISATNKDLKKLVEARDFREDLFYRINLITIELPPLRERKEDIPLLAKHFVDQVAAEYHLEELAISKTAQKWLTERPWPGNIRELKNLVERTALMINHPFMEIEDFEANFEHAPRLVKDYKLPPVGVMTLDQLEVTMIRNALEHHDHNLSQVAKSLGLSRSALYRRMDKYGIDYK
ncbi:MAG: sigma-54-dependent Fis family transcriptional regulator [Candidatus Marinimicrobia bacterium]|nr:sigma-54-dependent Fis family transcriptional regulator [Candidatus Neomarinimicrobiota bacterium]